MITHEVGVSSSVLSDKVILLFQGKATLVRKHWNGLERPVGLALLWLGVALRALFAGSTSRGGSRELWLPVWRARRRWLAGYPPAVGGGAGRGAKP